MAPQFTLFSDALPAKHRLRGFRGTESLSQPYAFDIVVELGPHALADLDAPVGKPATLYVNDERGVPLDSIHGILSTLELVDARPERELYRTRLVPRLWWLGQNRHSRVFVGDKLPAILDKVFKAAGWGQDDYQLVLKGRPGKGYPALEHVCQYRESDLDFLSRWMEREGLYYYFEEGKGGLEKLVVTDDAAAHRTRVVGARAYVPQAAAGGDRVEGFRSFRRTSHAQPAGVRLADYNYLNPELPVGHTEKSGEGALISVFGENVPTPDEARWLTNIRTQELRARQVIYRGAGRVHGIHPADKFSLSNHPRVSDELLAVEVQHRGLDLEGQPGLRGIVEDALGEELDEGYGIEVAAIPAAVQYRPPRVTPTPRVMGMESAVVDGAADDKYAQLDEHGRYNVRLKFDESDLKDGRASTRLRMVQPHGGKEEGFHFPLRKGVEVMVAFVGGDPDQPIITGVSPNLRTPSLITRVNATQNKIQTGGGNQLIMEDLAGSQAIDLNCPTKDSHLHLGAGTYGMELSTGGAGHIHVGSDLKFEVEGARTDTVTKDFHETFSQAQITQAKTREDTVDGTVTETFKGHHVHKVTKDGVLRDVVGKEMETLHDGLEQTVEKGLKQTVTQGVTLVHEGPFEQKIDGELVKIKIDKGMVTIDAKVGIQMNSDGPIEQHGKTNLITETKSKIEVTDFKGTVAKAVSTVTHLAANMFNLKAENHGIKADFTSFNFSNKALTLENIKAAFGKKEIKAEKTSTNLTVNILVLQQNNLTIFM